MMARKVGHVVSPAARSTFLRELLMSHYDDTNPDFWREWALLLRRYYRVVSALEERKAGVPDTHLYGSKRRAWRAAHIAASERPRGDLHRYLAAVEEFTQHWGPQSEWGPEWHHGSFLWAVDVWRHPLGQSFLYERQKRGRLASPVVNLIPSPSYPTEIDSLDTSIEIYRTGLTRSDLIVKFEAIYMPIQNPRFPPEPELKEPAEDPIFGQPPPVPRHIWDGLPVFHDWSELEADARQALMRQRDGIRSAHLKGGLEMRDTEPELMSHIGWLYLRICPSAGSGKPWGWGKIANDKAVSKYTVRDAVLALAQEMGIGLPLIGPGRPPKFA